MLSSTSYIMRGVKSTLRSNSMNKGVGEKRIGSIRSLGVRSQSCARFYSSGEESTPPPSGGRGRGMSFGFTPQKKETESHMEEPLDDHVPEYEEDHMAYYDDYEPYDAEDEVVEEDPSSYDGLTEQDDKELDSILSDKLNGPKRLYNLLDEQVISPEIPEHLNYSFDDGVPEMDEKKSAEHELMELSKQLGEPDHRKMKESGKFQMYDDIEKPRKDITRGKFLETDIMGEYMAVAPQPDVHKIEVYDHHPDDRTKDILNLIKHNTKSNKVKEVEKYKTIKGYDETLGDNPNIQYSMRDYTPLVGVPFDPPKEEDDAFDIIDEDTSHLGDPLFDRLKFVHNLLYRILRGGWKRSDKRLMKNLKRYVRFKEWHQKSYDKRLVGLNRKRENQKRKKELKKRTIEMMKNSDDYFYYSELDMWLSRDQLQHPSISNTVAALSNNPKWTRKDKKKIITDINRFVLRMEFPDPHELQKVRFVTRFDKAKPGPESGSKFKFDVIDWNDMIEELELDMHDQDRAEKFSKAPIDLNPPKPKAEVVYDAEGMPAGEASAPTSV